MLKSTDLHLERIAHNSEAYRQAVVLRNRVLREPLGLTLTPEQLAGEADDIHLVAQVGGKIIGSLILTPLAPHTAQMRQVAVDAPYQKQGIGRALVTFAESVARQHGYTTLILHARVVVLPFYTQLGYTPYGEPFEEVTLPHLAMQKTLQEETTGDTGKAE